ncbi:MAG: glycosyltransferase family 2 protein [Candidatus Promineifilaceae bacterium]|nr:glycosyltransferase family 2 protein [Candidatus Promineifilaceae bacterium]
MTEANSEQPLVYLIVLNWNGFEDTDECIRSLQQVSYSNQRILVVDNGSSDDSPERIEETFPELALLRLNENKGIAYGYNRGMEAALANGADYLVVMNNDLVFHSDFVTQMLKVQQNWSGCGVVMPKIYYYEAPEVIWSAGGRTRWMPSNVLLRGRKQKDGPAYATATELDFAPSCCLLMTADVAGTVSFDEDYFFYYDDWDFCRQVRDAGWRIVFAPDAHIWHKVSQSTQNSPNSLRWWRILGQSCVRYHRKHHNHALLLVYVAWVVVRELAKGNIKSLPSYLQGVFSGVRAEVGGSY